LGAQSIRGSVAKYPLTLKTIAPEIPPLLWFRRPLICSHQQSQGANNVF